MSEVAIAFRGVTKSFAGVDAVTNFTLDVPAGEIVGLVGENGAGKTTLIKCLLDFCDVDSGTIEIFGVPNRLTAARARLAYVPERFNPPFYLTGRDFLQYLARMHQAPYEQTRVEAMFRALDLDPSALARPARSYSKGMAQKLALAASLLSDKQLYILDEPTSGLDPKARALVKDQLKQTRAARRTIFLTSHSLADVAEMCDRMALVHQGRLRFAGSPEEFVRRYDAPDIEQAFLACIASAPAAA